MSKEAWALMDTASEEWRKGYADQTQWLQGKSLPAAEQALSARLATMVEFPYNQGGNAATADYIEQQRGEKDQ